MILEGGFITETIFSGFVLKVVNNVWDLSWETIKSQIIKEYLNQFRYHLSPDNYDKPMLLGILFLVFPDLFFDTHLAGTNLVHHKLNNWSSCLSKSP